MAGGTAISVLALSAIGTLLAGMAALLFSGGRADLRVVVLLGALGLLAAATLPFAWVAAFGRP